MAEIKWIGIKELKAAVDRNPKVVLEQARNFLTRGLAAYKQGIIRNPWRMNSGGGGSPVATGNLRDTHITKINALEGIIMPNLQLAKYAPWVHEGTKKMGKRPWLDYVKAEKQPDIDRLQGDFFNNILKDLKR